MITYRISLSNLKDGNYKASSKEITPALDVKSQTHLIAKILVEMLKK